MADARHRLLEICVDDAAGLEAAIKGGADRIELCSALGIGGLTPSYGLMRHAGKVAQIPVYALIRARAGGFDYTDAEIEMMENDIASARESGLAGVVIGATRGKTLDELALKRLIDAANGLDITLHRAFDMVKNPIRALETAIELGIPRILTSGCAKNVSLGFETLEMLAGRADGRISIMPGGGVTANLVPRLLALPGIHEIHASGSSSVAEQASLVDFGFAPAQRRQTDETVVRQLKKTVLAR